MALTLSCAFATSFESPEHARVAESLGYRRAWFYDSPALYPDVWVSMALAAERTSTIGLGTGVLIPSLRHVAVTAAAIAHLCHLAPGRVTVGIGSGFTGRLTMGQRPLPWGYVRDYVMALRALLRGGTVDWEGGAVRMMQPAGFAPARPIEVPIVIAAAGPKGLAVAREVGDGVFGGGAVVGAGFDWSVVLQFGTVLADGEDPGSERVLAAAGHGAAVAIHARHEFQGGAHGLPNGEAWEASLAEVPERERHIALHDLHLIGLNQRDRIIVDGAFMRSSGAARSPAEWRDHLAALEARGATEVAYQPAGPDIPGELERFARVATG